MFVESLLPGVEEFLMQEEGHYFEEEVYMSEEKNNSLGVEDQVYLRMSERERDQYENLPEEKQELFLGLISKAYQN